MRESYKSMIFTTVRCLALVKSRYVVELNTSSGRGGRAPHGPLAVEEGRNRPFVGLPFSFPENSLGNFTPE